MLKIDIRIRADLTGAALVRGGRLLAAALIAACLGGCATTDWVKVRHKPNLPLASELNMFSWTGPEPTARTQQVLRRYDLQGMIKDNRLELIAELTDICTNYPTTENVFALAEVAYISGKQAQDDGELGQALDFYGVSVAHAYAFLLGDEFAHSRNPYDPQFRLASDIYNGALEGALRVVQARGELKPGTTHVVATATQQYDVTIQCRGPWRSADIEELKFVSDYQVQGLKNHYRTYGLGVPLIAVHSHTSTTNPAEPYYAPGMSFPVTAFLQVMPDIQTQTEDGKRRHFCVLELHDPLVSSNLYVNGLVVPLETDLSTPLAYSLNNPTFQRANTATRGLLDPARSQDVQGLYMLEPYDPDKIPVVMVHGLWSNLITWMEMFNDLRGNPEIRNHYQFWFYLYPTGQPFWLTASQMRSDLARARRDLDPALSTPALDQLVLVGHSMGGLVARMQTLESGNDFWDLVSDERLTDLSAPAPVVDTLRRALYFGPNPSVKRVITIASPHRGSKLSNGATQWLGHHLINLPDTIHRTLDQVAGLKPDETDAAQLLKARTSIDSLSPESPMLATMRHARPAPWVKYHNVIGRIAEEGFLSRVAGESDGIVTTESARVEDAVSEKIVAADHMNIHRHPKTVLEVQRVLLEHLDEVSRTAMQRLPTPSISRLPDARMSD